MSPLDALAPAVPPLLGGLVVLLLGWVALARRWRRRAAAEIARAQVEQSAAHEALHRAVADLEDRARLAEGRITALEGEVERARRLRDEAGLRADGGERFAHAISLVRWGADVDDLVSACGLARGEAELLRRLHGPARGDAARAS